MANNTVTIDATTDLIVALNAYGIPYKKNGLNSVYSTEDSKTRKLALATTWNVKDITEKSVYVFLNDIIKDITLGQLVSVHSFIIELEANNVITVTATYKFIETDGFKLLKVTGREMAQLHQAGLVEMVPNESGTYIDKYLFGYKLVQHQ